jgi:hypothetical protein
MRTTRFNVSLEGVEVFLFPDEVTVFVDIANDLRAIIETPALGDDPVRERLFPRAYLDPTEESAEISWAAFSHPELLESRILTLEVIIESLKRLKAAKPEHDAGDMQYIVLSMAETEHWLKGLNDLRLALGTRLNIEKDEDNEPDEDDPTNGLRQIYNWLSALQQDLLEQVYL